MVTLKGTQGRRKEGGGAALAPSLRGKNLALLEQNIYYFGANMQLNFRHKCCSSLPPPTFQLEEVLYAYGDINHEGERLILDMFT